MGKSSSAREKEDTALYSSALSAIFHVSSPQSESPFFSVNVPQCVEQ